MNWYRFLQLELKNFLSGRGVLTGLLVIFLAGLYAIEHGRRVIAAQQQVIAATPQMQREHLQKMVAQHATPDPLNTLYYLNFFTTHEPSRYAPLSIGLRDVNPFNLKIRMLTLEGQLYDSEISNPTTLALGNFDLAFLLVFLYPLLIIAFTHNTLSSEQEQGIWPLLCSQPVAAPTVLAVKASLRFLPVVVVWLLTLLTSVAWLRLPLDRRFGSILFVSLAYLLFWFAVVWLVVSFKRSSNFNALLLLGVWLTLAILLPAASNIALSTLLPVPEAFAVSVNQREGYHQQWDRPKAETMQKFFQHYPEYASFQAPAEKFSWGWYYAAQHLGDVDAADAAAQLRAKLLQRQQWTQRLAWVTPTINAQTAFNRIAQTELENHLAYLDSVRQFHEQVRKHFYPFLLRNDAPPPINWQQLPSHSFNAERLAHQAVLFPSACWSLLAISLGFCWLAQFRLRARPTSLSK